MPKNSIYRECVELDPQQKWQYLQRYYDAARSFYPYQEEAASAAEIEAALRNFKEKPAPVIRRSIPLKEWKFREDIDDRGLREGFFSHLINDDTWEPVQLPHST